MNAKFEYGILVLSILLPFVLVSIITDLTKRTALSLSAIAAGATFLYLVNLTTSGHQIEVYLIRGRVPYILGALLGASAILFYAVVTYVSRRNYRRMNWPVSISQMSMERHGVAKLRRAGWLVTEEGRFHGGLIFRCRKDDYRLMAFFTKDHIAFEAFCSGMRKTQIALTGTVIISYQEPTKVFQGRALAVGVSVMFYKDIPNIDLVAAGIMKRKHAARMAFLALKPKVRV